MRLISRIEKLEERSKDQRPTITTIIYRIVEPSPNGPRLVQSLRREPDGRLMELAA